MFYDPINNNERPFLPKEEWLKEKEGAGICNDSDDRVSAICNKVSSGGK